MAIFKCKQFDGEAERASMQYKVDWRGEKGVLGRGADGEIVGI